MQGNVKRASKQTGFTIVELLIVVVVIAILAAITIVAYNGIRERAQVSSIQSSLSSLNRSLEVAKIQSSTQTYPATLAAASSPDVTYQYLVDTNNYCLQQRSGSISLFTTAKQSTPTPGVCDGLIGWWPLNGSVDDMMQGVATVNSNGASGVGQNGTADSGWYLQGDATTRSILTDLYFSPQAFTSSVWFRADGNGPSGFASLISNTRDCCQTLTGFQIDYNLTSLDLRARLWNGGGGPARTIAAVGSVTVGQWQHVAVSYNGTRFIMYLNGQLVASSDVIVSPGMAGLPMKIGGMGTHVSGHSFGGSLDDVRVYNRPLSADEIADMYRLGAQ